MVTICNRKNIVFQPAPLPPLWQLKGIMRLITSKNGALAKTLVKLLPHSSKKHFQSYFFTLYSPKPPIVYRFYLKGFDSL